MKKPDNPTRPLHNSRHEAFCRNLAKGMTQEKAYIMAGYSVKGSRFQSSHLATKRNIQARLDYLKTEAATDAVMKREEALKMHTLAARQRFAAASRYVNLTPDGDLSLDADPEKMKNDSSIKKVKVRVDSSGTGDGKNDARFIEMEFHDCMEPLRELAKLEGWNAAEQHQVKTDGEIKITFEEVALPEKKPDAPNPSGA